MSDGESSPTVPVGPADGEPAPGISTVLQALVEQMKSMNEKMDSMAPARLSDGELEGDATQETGSVVSIDTRLQNLTTRASTKTTATQSSQTLKDIA